MVRLVGFGFVVSVLLASAPARAMDFRGDGEVTIGPDQRVDDDLYVTGGNVAIQGAIDGDLAIMGGQIEVDGPVSRNLFVAGGDVILKGPVDGTVRVMGGNILIDGAVRDDVLAAGGSVTLGKDAVVGRDLAVGSGEVKVNGTVARNLLAAAGELTVAGQVRGNVRGRMDRLVLEQTARVGGDVRYVGEEAPSVSPGAVVAGRLEREAPTPGGAAKVVATVFGRLRRYVGALALGLVFLLVFPVFGRRGVTALAERPWAGLGVGLLFLLLVPVVAVLVTLLGLLVGGWWLGLLVVGVYALALALGYVLAGVEVGAWILDRLGRAKAHAGASLALGLAVLVLLGTVPFVGPAVAVVAVLFGTGALARTALRAFRARKAGEAPSPT